MTPGSRRMSTCRGHRGRCGKGVLGGEGCRQIAYSEGILDLGGGSLEWNLHRGLSGWIMYVDYQIISRFLQLFSSLSI